MFKKLFLLLSITCVPLSLVSLPTSQIVKGLGGVLCFVPVIVAATKLYNGSSKHSLEEDVITNPLTAAQVFAPTVIASSLALGASLMSHAVKNSPISATKTALQLTKVAAGSFMVNMGRIVFQQFYDAGNKEILPKIIAGGASALLVASGGYLGFKGLARLI